MKLAELILICFLIELHRSEGRNFNPGWDEGCAGCDMSRDHFVAIIEPAKALLE